MVKDQYVRVLRVLKCTNNYGQKKVASMPGRLTSMLLNNYGNGNNCIIVKQDSKEVSVLDGRL